MHLLRPWVDQRGEEEIAPDFSPEPQIQGDIQILPNRDPVQTQLWSWTLLSHLLTLIHKLESLLLSRKGIQSCNRTIGSIHWR